MSDLTLNPATLTSAREAATPATLRYGVPLLLVGIGVVLGEGFERLVSTANVTLFFVLPVVIAGASFGWGPALTTTLAGVLAFDFFFTEPRYSLAIASPADICDAALLLVIAAIVSAVSAESRRRALEARRAADRAEALQTLAHAVIESRPEREIARIAAKTLNRIFGSPAVIFREMDGRLDLIAGAGPTEVDAADEDAARVSASSHAPTRAEAFPAEEASFDFWPVAAGPGRNFVLGVDFSSSKEERPAAATRFVEMIGGYLAASPAAGYAQAPPSPLLRPS
jgi:K+-sensing histidine kinase KdpD